MTDALLPVAEPLLFAVPGLPLLLAALLAVPALRGAVRLALPLAALPALAAALALPAPLVFEEPWLMLGARVGLDATAQAFLFFSGALWAAAGLGACAYMRADPERTGFLACFLLAMAGNLGLFVADDAFTLYAAFATMSFAAYGLVVHGRDAASLRAGRVYIAFVVAGELALFAGLALAAHAAGSALLADLRAAPMPGLAALLLALGFGAKLGLAPLHLWLPLAHAAAPVPASAVLSGAMIKAGLFGLLAVLPFGAAALPALGLALAASGAASILLSAAVGVTQSSPKAVLAYSSVGQVGLVALALGVGLVEPAAWPLLAPALVAFAAHHAFAKGALFLGVGVVAAQSRPARRALALAALLLPAAALAALPFTMGYRAKSALEAAMAAGPAPWAGALPLAVALGSGGTALLMARLALLLWRQPMAAAAPRGSLAPSFALALALPLLLPLGWPLPWPEAGPLAAGAVVAAAAPAALALALGLTAWAALRLAEIPPGEALALIVPRPPAPTPPAPRRAPSRGLALAWRAPFRGRAAATPGDPWGSTATAALALLVVLLALGAEAPARLLAALTWSEVALRLAPG